MNSASVDTKDFKSGVWSMIKSIQPEEILLPVVNNILNDSIIANIPEEECNLLRSKLIEVSKSDTKSVEYVFGFTKIYSYFQDQPKLSSGSRIIITPRADSGKKFLYIALSKQGRQHQRGANPKMEGLVWGRDYVLRHFVTIPVKSYRSTIGPNKYFSGTWKIWQDKVIPTIGRIIRSIFFKTPSTFSGISNQGIKPTGVM
jgi:hypothetical protein